ncbi:MAG: alpha/beta fold hydrolase [Alphaproteobacteria bacterium]|nr:alpha/beta fold hydrolase [Alphaproteobacteria bacterium]
MEPSFVPCLSPAGPHKVAYYVWGRADAPRTVICVHGLTRNAQDFNKLALALSESGAARVVGIDVVGRGRSDWLADPVHYSYPQYLADMGAIIAHLGVSEVDWVGTSMGGIIGFLLAAHPKTPVRRLVLNDVGPFIPAEALARIASYTGLDLSFSSKAAVEAYFRKTYELSGPMTDDDFAHITAYGTRTMPDGSFKLCYDPKVASNFADIKTDVDLWDFYDRVQAPTLLLHGELSDVLSAQTAQEMTARGPKAELVEIPGIGHIPTLTDAHQIGVIRRFLGL